MIDEFRKSINSILYERVSSPFWGAAIISWVIWNWEIFYLTFFVPSEKISETKIIYIKENYLNDLSQTLGWPLLTLFLILVVFPFVSNGAYYLSLKFNNWKVDQKRKLEKKIPLSVEESIKLRNEILKQEERFLELTKEKEEWISELQKNINLLKEENSDLKDKLNTNLEELNEAKLQIKIEKDRKNFNDIFKGSWVYETQSRAKEIFRIYNERMFEFKGGKKLEMYPIKRYNSENLEILLYPERLDVQDTIEFRILKIDRASNVEDFEGTEFFFRKMDGNVYAEINKVNLRKLP